MAKRTMPPRAPQLTDDLAALFKLMREEKVFVFKGLGVEVQMAQQAWDQPQPVSELVRQLQQPEREAPPEDMPPELRGPYEAFRKRPAFIPAPGAAAVETPEPGVYRDPTDPDAPINEAAERGEDLPDWNSGGNY